MPSTTRKARPFQPPIAVDCGTGKKLGHRVVSVALFAFLSLGLSGCDWKFAETMPHGNALDLTHFGAQDGSWRLRAGDSAVWSQPCSGDTCHLEMTVYGGHAATLRRKVRWDAESHPILRWSWGVTPADSLAKSRINQADAVVALDVTLASSFGFEKTLRYVWSPRHDKGKIWASGDNWRPKAVVLRDRRDFGKIMTDSVNVWEDFRRTFGYVPRHLALSVAVSVRSNNPNQPVAVRFGSILAQPEHK
ncbi:MAG: hypothetical protein RL318_613 [Fibrobacterota bacterium]